MRIFSVYSQKSAPIKNKIRINTIVTQCHRNWDKYKGCQDLTRRLDRITAKYHSDSMLFSLPKRNINIIEVLIHARSLSKEAKKSFNQFVCQWLLKNIQHPHRVQDFILSAITTNPKHKFPLSFIPVNARFAIYEKLFTTGEMNGMRMDVPSRLFKNLFEDINY